MRVGRLRQVASIQTPTETRNAQGESTTGYTTADTVWARIKPLDGREYVSADGNVGETRYEVSIRAYSGLTTKHRLLWGTKTLNIESLNDTDGRGAEYVLICKEVSA